MRKGAGHDGCCPPLLCLFSFKLSPGKKFSPPLRFLLKLNIKNNAESKMKRTI